MKLATIFAGLGILALTAMPVAAQRGFPGNRPGGIPGIPGPGTQQVPGTSQATPLPPPKVHMPRAPQTPPGTPPLPENQPGFYLGNPTAPNGPTPGFNLSHPVQPPGTVPPGFGIGPGRLSNLNNFPLFFFGAAGQPFCSPFASPLAGRAFRFTGEFSCFGGSFYTSTFVPFPANFLPPELAYAPWLMPSLQSSGDLAQTIRQLDIMAGIAARESGESIPPEQTTQLVLRDGFIFGVTDYWTENGKLGYVTTYQKQRSIDLAEVDLDKTAKLNSDRGKPFVLRERPAAPATPANPANP